MATTIFSWTILIVSGLLFNTFFTLGFWENVAGGATVMILLHVFKNFIVDIIVDMVVAWRYRNMSQEDFNLVAASLEADCDIEVSRDITGKPLTERTFTIVATPEEPIGTYMGVAFFDWLDLEDATTQKTDRWFFVQCVESRWKVDLKPNQVVCFEHFVYQLPQSSV